MLKPQQLRILQQTVEQARTGSRSAMLLIHHIQTKAKEGDEASKALEAELRRMAQQHEASEVRKVAVIEVQYILQVYEHQGGGSYLWTNHTEYSDEQVAVHQAQQIANVTRVVRVSHQTVWESDPPEEDVDTERAS